MLLLHVEQCYYFCIMTIFQDEQTGFPLFEKELGIGGKWLHTGCMFFLLSTIGITSLQMCYIYMFSLVLSYYWLGQKTSYNLFHLSQRFRVE